MRACVTKEAPTLTGTHSFHVRLPFALHLVQPDLDVPQHANAFASSQVSDTGKE